MEELLQQALEYRAKIKEITRRVDTLNREKEKFDTELGRMLERLKSHSRGQPIIAKIPNMEGMYILHSSDIDGRFVIEEAEVITLRPAV